MTAPVRWRDIEREFEGSGPFGLDAEWSDDGIIRCFSVACGPPRPSTHRGPWTELRGYVLLRDELAPARRWLRDSGVMKVGALLQDADLPRFQQAGIELRGVAGCVVTACRLWDPDIESAGLKEQAVRYLGYRAESFKNVTGYLNGATVWEPQSSKGFKPVESVGRKIRPEGPFTRLRWNQNDRRACVSEVMADENRYERFLDYARLDAVMALDLYWFWLNRFRLWATEKNRPAVRGAV